MADLKDRNGLFSPSVLASTRSQNGNFYFSYEFRAFWVNPKKILQCMQNRTKHKTCLIKIQICVICDKNKKFAPDTKNVIRFE